MKTITSSSIIMWKSGCKIYFQNASIGFTPFSSSAAAEQASNPVFKNSQETTIQTGTYKKGRSQKESESSFFRW